MIPTSFVAARQNRYLRRFQKAGATSPESARTLQELGEREGPVWRQLVRKRLMVEAGDGRYWLDEPAAKTFLRRRLVGATILLALLLAATAFLLWP